MIRFALVLLIATPLLAQESLLFPRFSVIAGSSAGEFTTDVRIDPDDQSSEGTLVSFERDLGLEDSKTLPRFALQWRPPRRHAPRADPHRRPVARQRERRLGVQPRDRGAGGSHRGRRMT
ncbi:MAG TPA: hypothetical protein VNA69_04355 [Thermoanaerobaculia bacterium]|nr:hypothetical protein [Thermoanaerobaculia bacterium]